MIDHWGGVYHSPYALSEIRWISLTGGYTDVSTDIRANSLTDKTLTGLTQNSPESVKYYLLKVINNLQTILRYHRNRCYSVIAVRSQTRGKQGSRETRPGKGNLTRCAGQLKAR